MRAILVAAAFLTRTPIPIVATAGDVARAVRWFPLIGAVLGVAALLAVRMLHDALGLTPLLSAALVVAAGAWITGAIHLDGLADFTDGIAGGTSPEDARRIMREPAVGACGAAAVALLVVTKVAAVAALIERPDALAFIVAAPALSRCGAVGLGFGLPYAAVHGGLGRVMTDHRTWSTPAVAAVVTVIVAVGMLQARALLAGTLAVIATAAIGRLAWRRVGGVTGDVFGAVIEVTETLVLIGGAAASRQA